jgi:hypothetical protein
MKDGLRDLVALLSNFGLPADLAEPPSIWLSHYNNKATRAKHILKKYMVGALLFGE